MAFVTLKTGMEESMALRYCDCLDDRGSLRWTCHMQHTVRREAIAC